MYDPTATIFWTGFFACMFSIAPLMVLMYLPSTKYLMKEEDTQREKDLRERIKQLELEVRLHETLAGSDIWYRTVRGSKEKTSN
jgi:hypothetical protein